MDRDDINKHFQKLRFRLIAGMLLFFIMPLAALTIFFHVRFTKTVTESNRLDLTAFAESLGNTIDLFAEERVVNLFALFLDSDFSVPPSPEKMQSYLNQLRQVSGAFLDIGFLNRNGEQLAHAGTDGLLKKTGNPSQEWIQSFVEHPKEYFISNISKNIEGTPYFIIAVKQTINGSPYIIRSIIDPEVLFAALKKVRHVEDFEFGLLDSGGKYWPGRQADNRLSKLNQKLPIETGQFGIHEIKADGTEFLAAHIGLDEAPWTLIVIRSLRSTYTDIDRSNKLMTAGMFILLIIVSVIFMLAINRFVHQARKAAETRQELRYQLIHASKLASVGELATGIAHEINNPLAIITATSTVIRDLFDPEFGLDASPEKVLAEVDTIESAAFRARGITRQLLDYGRKYEPKKIACDLNALLEEVLAGLKEKEFILAQIELIRKYKDDLPPVLADPDQIRQVFLNLINNAGDAIDGPGTIEIITESDNTFISASVKDSGKGMTPEQLEKIFDPFYTTKEVGKGTGLGLSISLNIIESMGGTIDVRSQKGAGSTFKVSFPILEMVNIEKS